MNETNIAELNVYALLISYEKSKKVLEKRNKNRKSKNKKKEKKKK